MDPEHAMHRPDCPRCGYDQSGVVATWTAQCPVEGRCPECGTKFAWADLFDPSRQRLRWLAEHAATNRQAARRTAPTVFRALLPWVFWSRVRVQTRSDPVRLGLWLLVWVGGVHLLSTLPVWIFLMNRRYWGLPLWRAFHENDQFNPELFASALVNGLCWPLFETWPRGYGFYSDIDPEEAVPYLSPIWTAVCWVLLFLILPTTRRLAKLRFAHLWRAFCIQCAVVLPALEVARVLGAAYEHFWQGWLLWVAVVIPLVLHVWAVLWWAWAIRVGWSIRSWALLVLGFVLVLLSMPFAVGVVMLLVDWASGGPRT